MELMNNCHGCKWLDVYKKTYKPGKGYCSTIVRSKGTDKNKCRTPEMKRCELYEEGDWEKRFEK